MSKKERNEQIVALTRKKLNDAGILGTVKK